MTQEEIVRRLVKAGSRKRAAGMWVVWRAGRSRGPGRKVAAVLCAGRVKRKRREVLITERSDRVRVHEAWLLPRWYPVADMWPLWDNLGTFKALGMDEAATVLGAIMARGEAEHGRR